MRYERLVDLLRLAIAMSGTAEGLSLDEMAAWCLGLSQHHEVARIEGVS